MCEGLCALQLITDSLQIVSKMTMPTYLQTFYGFMRVLKMYVCVCPSNVLTMHCPRIPLPVICLRVYVWYASLCFVCGCMCGHMWRPEVDVHCLPWSLSNLYIETGPLPQLGAFQASSLPWISLSLPSSAEILGGYLSHLLRLSLGSDPGSPHPSRLPVLPPYTFLFLWRQGFSV